MKSEESFLKKLDTELATGTAVSDDRRGIFHSPKEKPVPDDWESSRPAEHNAYEKIMNQRTKQQSFFKKMFFVACLFAILSAGLFAFSLFTGRARLTGENVDVTVQSKTFADSGEEITVRVTVTNKNPVAMESAKLIFSYPVGNTRDPNAQKTIERPLGVLDPGAVHDETFTITLFGEQGTEKTISGLVEYQLRDSNKLYEKSGTGMLTLRSSIASLVVNAVDTVLPGQDLPITITVSGNASGVVNNALLVAEYPDGCSFVRSNPAPTLDRDVWFLGDLPAGSQQEIAMVVNCSGITNSEKNILFTLGSQNPTNERMIESVYTSNTHLVKLSSAFLATTILVNGKPFDATVSVGQNREATIDIMWQNTLDTAVSDVSVRAKLSGTAFDAGKVRGSTAFFDTNTNTLIWSSNENPSLKNVQPGQSGQLTFQMTPRAGLAGASTIDIALDITGVSLGGQQESLMNVNRIAIPVNTDLQLVSKILYHSGPLQNTGPMPMQVGKETTFTITWQIANTPNPANGVVVKTNLPTGISWKNVVAPVGRASEISYNTVTREITWNAGDVPVGQNATSISFKLGIVPSGTQLGQVPNLTTDIMVTGTDSVTKTMINQTKRALNTRLIGDVSNVGAEGKVTPTQ